MRFLLLIILLCFVSAPSYAQEDKQEKPNYARESLGLLSSDLQGAFPKSLWKDQPRSEIQYLLASMPVNGTNKAIQKLKREFLISQADTRLIKNDIKTEQYKDIFALRLKKLMELGQYDDAFKLYTSAIETPETQELAEIGLLLTLDKQGLSTACLDVKVLISNFEQTSFWQNINTLCNNEIGASSREFKDSSILQGIYNDKDFFLPAQYTERFSTFSPLELHILFKKGRVKYSELKAEHISSILPQITRFFINDDNFPKKLEKALQEYAANQNLFKIAADSKKNEEEEEEEEDATNDNTPVSQQNLEVILKESLIRNLYLTEKLEKRLYTLASENPQNYVYIQIFSLLGLTSKEYQVPEDKLNAGLGYFTEKSAEKVNFIKTILDKPTKFSNNPVSVYEKHLVLSEDGQYKLPEAIKQSGINQNLWSGWQQEVEIQKFIGLSFLIALHNDLNDLDEYQDQTQRVLSSLSTVGLIEKTHQLSREYFANMVGTK